MVAKNPFQVSHPDQSSGFLLWKVTTLWQREIKKALEPFHVSHAQFVLLASLLWFDGKRKTLSQVELVDSTKLDKMTISASLKKLVKEELVLRTENQEDTRAKDVSLTRKGKALAKKLVPIVGKVDRRFFAALNQDEAKTLRELFKKTLTN